MKNKIKNNKKSKKSKEHVLYLIKKRKGNLFKIGITTNNRLRNRMNEIERAFGKLNYSQSYLFFSTEKREIIDLERILHLIFRPQRRDNHFKEGAGKTEWFNSKISSQSLKIVKSLRKMNNFKHISAVYNLEGEHEYIMLIKDFFLLTFFSNIFSNIFGIFKGNR